MQDDIKRTLFWEAKRRIDRHKTDPILPDKAHSKKFNKQWNETRDWQEQKITSSHMVSRRNIHDAHMIRKHRRNLLYISLKSAWCLSNSIVSKSYMSFQDKEMNDIYILQVKNVRLQGEISFGLQIQSSKLLNFEGNIFLCQIRLLLLFPQALLKAHSLLNTERLKLCKQLKQEPFTLH
jgi:hypothetical protein